MRRFGEYIYARHNWILLIWVFSILVLGFFALKLPNVLSGNGFEYNGEYSKTRKILEEKFGEPQSSIILVFKKESKVSEKDFLNFIQDTFENIDQLESIQEVIIPLEQHEMIAGNYAYGLIHFNKNAENLGKEIKQLKMNIHSIDGITVTMTGEPIIVQDLNTASQEDLAKAEMIGLPIALIVLLLAFGSIVAASLPILIGIVSILTTMGTIYFFSYGIDLTIFILNIVPMIGLALSIDFALLFINRYKEEIAVHSVKDAVVITLVTAGRSIIFSGLCVFIGLSGLWFINIDIFQNVALGGMTVVLISVICALTFLPACLALLGNKINKFSILKLKGNPISIWHRFAVFVMKRPLFMTILAILLLLGGLLPVKQITLAIPGTESLPSKYPSRVAYEQFKVHFVPKERRSEKQVTIILETEKNILSLENLHKARKVIDLLEEDKLVAFVDSPFSVTGIKDEAKLYSLLHEQDKIKLAPMLNHFVINNQMRLDVFLKTKPHSDMAREWVQDWSNKELGMKASLGGSIKFEQEIFSEIYDKSPYGLLLIMTSTFFILMAAFRSLLIPLKAILMNGLSLGCTFGIVVWIFQFGHLGVKPVEIALILPVFVFSLVFGLSMDYEVFLISRIQEFYFESGNNSEATISGLTFTSKIISSAAAIMIVVTGAFAFTGVMPVKQLGVGIAIAIFIDATIVRMILVPALMKLLGDWNWWFFGFHHTKKLAGKR